VSRSGDLRAAVAAGVLGAESMQAALLRSIVDVARAIFGARASSIMLHDTNTDELVFAAVAGEGSEHLVGTRISATTGIAGWVLSAREPLVLENVAADPRFARDVADATGFVPKGIMAMPLLLEERALGVLSVLDRPERATFTLPEMELLGRFAHQAALAIELAGRAREARVLLDAEQSPFEDLAVLAESISQVEGTRRDAALAIIAAVHRLME
jgi:GAF domain-containing protein